MPVEVAVGQAIESTPEELADVICVDGAGAAGAAGSELPQASLDPQTSALEILENVLEEVVVLGAATGAGLGAGGAD